MRFKLSDKSLFAYLMRSPWWLSLLIAIVLVLGLRAVLPDEYSWYAPAFAFPFLVIGVYAAWKQRDVPSDARVARTVEAVSAMSWNEFSALMEQAFQREGFTVSRMNGAADFVLVKAGRTQLVSCKRWKAANLGLEPLRELQTLRETQDAQDASFVAIGMVSDNALRFARSNRIALLRGPELVRLLRLR